MCLQLFATQKLSSSTSWVVQVPHGQEVKFERSNTPQGPIIGGPFSIVNTEGKVVTKEPRITNWFLLYFEYTSSPDVAEVQKMVEAVALLAQHSVKVQPIKFTVDPQRVTPSQLSAYLKVFDQLMFGLARQLQALREMAQGLRIFYRKIDKEGNDFLVECSRNIYLLNPEMKVVRCFGVEYNAEELAEEILQDMNKT